MSPTRAHPGESVLARREADKRLAERCVAGDRDAQRALFHAHKERVHLILYRILGSNRDIDDIVQDAFLEIFVSLSNFRGDAQLGTWIDRITTRVAWRHLASREPRQARLELVSGASEAVPQPDATVLARRAIRKLYAILDELEPAQRIAFALFSIDGRPLKEIAAMTGSTLVATKVRVWRARRVVLAKAADDEDLASFVGGAQETRR